MPTVTTWTDPEVFFEHKGRKVFHTYDNDDIDQGKNTYRYTIDGQSDDNSFDVRGFAQCPSNGLLDGHPPFMCEDANPDWKDTSPFERVAIEGQWKAWSADYGGEDQAIKAVIREALDLGLLDTSFEDEKLSVITNGDSPRWISDDDLCANCTKCQEAPDTELSRCLDKWPGLQDEDGYVKRCASFEETPDVDTIPETLHILLTDQDLVNQDHGITIETIGNVKVEGGLDEYVLLKRKNDILTPELARRWLLLRVYREGNGAGEYLCHNVSVMTRDERENERVCVIEHRHDI